MPIVVFPAASKILAPMVIVEVLTRPGVLSNEAALALATVVPKSESSIVISIRSPMSVISSAGLTPSLAVNCI